MRLFIPSVGAQLRLLTDWTFTLYGEYRNSTFAKNVGCQGECRYWHATPMSQITLPAGTVLSVARIYIRNGKKDFDSITFTVKSCPEKKYKGRFWAKLDEVNEIECTVAKQ